MAKIDKINVGGTVYDINLPTTATPSISSLTITGNLTVNGTANLDNVNSLMTRAGTTAYFDTIVPNTISFGAQTLTLTGGSLSINTPTIYLNGQEVDLTYSQINAGNAASEI